MSVSLRVTIQVIAVTIMASLSQTRAAENSTTVAKNSNDLLPLSTAAAAAVVSVWVLFRSCYLKLKHNACLQNVWNCAGKWVADR